MDISDTLAPKSDQLDAVDLLGGPQTFTVASVSRGNAEQPVQVHLTEFPRVWRPGKTMRRVLAFCWGNDASQWVGRRVTLYCDADVMFGSEKVGGTRISHLSHIDKPMRVPVIVKKGRGGSFAVEPLPDAAPPVEMATNDQLQAIYDALASADKESALSQLSKGAGREITAANQLTKSEAAAVIDSLERDIETGKAAEAGAES